MSYNLQSLTVNGVAYPNPATFIMDNDKNVVANYSTSNMGTVTFSGTVSGQAAAGRSIVITITKPGGGTATVNAVTLADKTFTATYTDVAGSYSAVAKALADSQYAEGTSPAVSWSMTLNPTTVTLTVS
jgi:hypothetical protein